ncbi:MAG: glycoside hydrolase family 3 C-terminal domain-containing protein [Bacteroidota bacterium]
MNDLVSRMTLAEKTSQMLYTAPAIDRLGIPAYNWWNEALHGVARAGKATVFPQAIGLAATWDTDLMFRVATVISDEARAKHHEAVRQGRRGIYEGLTFWSPNINIFRDPRWGRGMETYGEDPYLTGKLAVEFVKGMQGNDPRYLKTVATPKHFAVHSGPEPLRHMFDAQVDERDLRETYLPAFRMCIVDGHAQSVMCAYNRFRGLPCCGSDELLLKILRDEWGFDGYVVSDCWAIMDFYTGHKVVATAPEAAAMAAQAGTDLNCGVTYDSLAAAVKMGLVHEQFVDVSVKRLFRERFRLGMFDPPERVAYARIPPEVNDSKEHRQLALEAARKSIVLLKNDRNTLPLSKSIRTLAVIGPNADDGEVLRGNYNGTPSRYSTPLSGLRDKCSKSMKILSARGCAIAEKTPTLTLVPAEVLSRDGRVGKSNGLKGEYFNNINFEGQPFVSRVDQVVDFEWWEDEPIAGMKKDSFSVRWTGFLKPPMSGRYALGVRVLGGVRLFVNDSLLLEFTDRHVFATAWKYVQLKEGSSQKLRLEYWDRRPEAGVGLLWERPDAQLKSKALDMARRADAVILVMGLSPKLEGEEMDVDVPGFHDGDRVDIGLPPMQEELIEDITALGKPTVLVLLNGSALAVNWAAEHVAAIVESWYGGEGAGEALADVLFGEYNPAGRLPVTFYKSTDQLPPFTEYAMKGRTYRYFTGDPLYTFGYGLSYTTFGYANLKMPAKVQCGDQVEVEVQVENRGDRAGDEVVQLYVSDLHASVPVPIRSLAGFRRVHLNPGEKQRVLFFLTPRQLSVIDGEGKRVEESGTFEISVGGKQPGMTGRADAKTTGVVVGRFEVTGERLVIGEKQY